MAEIIILLGVELLNGHFMCLSFRDYFLFHFPLDTVPSELLQDFLSFF